MFCCWQILSGVSFIWMCLFPQHSLRRIYRIYLWKTDTAFGVDVSFLSWSQNVTFLSHFHEDEKSIIIQTGLWLGRQSVISLLLLSSCFLCFSFSRVVLSILLLRHPLSFLLQLFFVFKFLLGSSLYFPFLSWCFPCFHLFQVYL